MDRDEMRDAVARRFYLRRVEPLHDARPWDDADPTQKKLALADADVAMQVLDPELGELFKRALYVRQTAITDLSDEDARRWLKQFAAYVERSRGAVGADKGWSTESEMIVGMDTLLAIQLVKTCLDMNAGQVTLDLHNVTLRGKESGDWRIRCEHIVGGFLDEPDEDDVEEPSETPDRGLVSGHGHQGAANAPLPPWGGAELVDAPGRGCGCGGPL